jgi:hypothetical protein
VVNEPPKYRSSTSVGKRQTIPIDINDPRLKPGKIGMVKARSGAEIEIVNLSNLGANSANFKVLNGNISGSNTNADLIVPPINNLPPSVYPGGSGPQIIVVSDPSNVSATWGSYSSSTFTAGAGDYLQITFNWDPSISTNATASQFIVSLTDSIGNIKIYGGFPITTGTTSQTILVTPAINESMFNIFTPGLTAVAVKVADPLNNTSNFITGTFSNGYTLNFAAPVITEADINNGYKISYTTPTSSSFSGIDIWEIESSAGTAPAVIYGTDGITPTNYSRVYFGTLSPAIVITPNLNQRYVIARFSSNGQVYTAFTSPGIKAQPVSVINVTNQPPAEIDAVSASWSADSIVISYTMPASNSGVRFSAVLTAPNGNNGSFYFYPDGTSSLNQTYTISSNDLYNQFGAYYSSFSGKIISIDTYDNRTPGVGFSVPQRSNPLAGVTPSSNDFNAIAISNGLLYLSTNAPFGTTSVNVYARTTDWGSDDPLPIDYIGTIFPPNPFVYNSTNYVPYYIKVQYLDNFGNTSNFSDQFPTITPLDPNNLASAPAGVPSVTLDTGGAGPDTLTVNIATQDAVLTKGYFLYYMPTGMMSAMSMMMIPSVGSGTQYTITGLKPGTSYDIYAAAYNSTNILSTNSSTLTTSTTTETVPDVTNITLSPISYGIQASWTAPSTPMFNIQNYEVELHQVSGMTDTIINTQYTFSTQISFGGLLPLNTYYVKVYAVDVYGITSAGISTSTPSNITLNSVGQTNTGSAPSAAPTNLSVSPLFNALEAFWTPVTDPESITYNVYLGTTSTFTPSNSNLVVQTQGSFAVIKNDGPGNPLSYTNTYYVKVKAINYDGAGPATSAVSGTPSQIQTNDIQANAVTANQIAAGSVYADKVDAQNLLVSKKFTVGTQISLITGLTHTSTTATLLTNIPHNFYAGHSVLITGLTPSGYNGVYTILASPAPTSTTFTISNTTNQNVASGFGVATVADNATYGIVIDGSGDGTATSPFTLYSGAGTYSDSGTPFYIDSIGRFSLKDRLSFDGNSTLTVNGVINATDGNFTGNIKVGAVNPMKIGINAGGSGNDGIYMSNTDYIYKDGKFKLGNGGVTWDGSSLTVAGSISLTSGNFSGDVSIGSGSIYGSTGTAVSISAATGGNLSITYTTAAATGYTAGTTRVYISGMTNSSFNGVFKVTGATSSSPYTFTVSTTSNLTGTNLTSQTGKAQNITNGFVLNNNTLNFGGNTYIDAGAYGRLVTTSAYLGNWVVDANKIENASGANYTGLSTTGTYSIYAGAGTGGTTPTFGVTPDGAVTANNITITGGQLDIGADSSHLSTGFHVTSAGIMYATGADITGRLTVNGSSLITGNLQVSTGTLYAGSSATTGSRVLINSNGLAAYDAGNTQTTLISSSALANGSTFVTTAATIGGWNVNSSQINKASAGGRGNIVLDSSNGYIYVSDANTPNYTAGINSASTSSAVAFWAGQGLTGSQPNPASASNAFRVTMGGALYASGATIDGVVTSTSNGVYGGTVKLDPVNDLISLTPSGSTYGAYIIPRNNNLYITAPSSTSPFSSGTQISSSGPTNGPYFSTGLSFSDYWGNTAVGAGMFTGPWNYFAAASGTAASAASKPFITTTSTGIQLSANADIGILIDAGTSATGTKLSSGSLNLNGIPSILLYTSKQTTAPWSPSTAYGAWMQMSPGALNLSATSSVFMGIYGSSATGLPTNANTNSIYIQAGTTRINGVSGGDGAYSANSKITLDSTYGTGIWALPIQGDISLTVATTPISPDYNPHYMNSYPLGPYPRQRMVVEDPVTGQSKLGMAVYYATGITQPSSGGYIGDLWVIY